MIDHVSPKAVRAKNLVHGSKEVDIGRTILVEDQTSRDGQVHDRQDFGSDWEEMNDPDVRLDKQVNRALGS